MDKKITLMESEWLNKPCQAWFHGTWRDGTATVVTKNYVTIQFDEDGEHWGFPLDRIRHKPVPTVQVVPAPQPRSVSQQIGQRLKQLIGLPAAVAIVTYAVISWLSN